LQRSLQLNPDNRPAVWAQIRQWREAHKRAPVATSFGVFDADNESDNNFTEMIEFFDGLPTLVNGKLTWKLADNSYLAITKAELIQIHIEIGEARAARGALLHVKAEQLNQMTPLPTPAQLSSLNFWLAQ